jgi:hypothetical protein
MSRGFRLSILLVATAGVLIIAAGAPGRSPVAQAAGSCNVRTGQGFGYSYLDKLDVKRTSCKNGRRVVLHRGHLRGWHCKHKRLDSNSFQYNERVTCKNHRREVKWVFTKNT